MTNAEKRAYHARKQREYRARNREVVNQRSRDALRAKALFLRDYKAERGCVDCGETDPVVLEFDHVDPSQKTRTVRAVNGRWTTQWRTMGRKTLDAELAKCEVRCANCHRRRTAKQFGYYEYESA